MTTSETTCKAWYDQSYSHSGFAAQRRYPNEELLRFFGRHYFPLPPEQRRLTRALEVGCGSGANLWMMVREGFDAHGIDLSAEAIRLCQILLQGGPGARLSVASMTACPYRAVGFDIVADVFSSYCLDEMAFATFLDEVSRLLRPGGHFFSYAPSKNSDLFKKPGPARRIDASTIDGIRRQGAPFYGNFYPFRFIAGDEYEAALGRRSLQTIYNERVGRTYNNGTEYFEFVVVVAQKK